jgi:beta-galactosidase
VPKRPGQLARLSLSHVARGSRGVMVFQWRASAAGAEQYHSAIVPHAGPDSRIFAEARELGRLLPRLAEAGGEVVAEVAIAWHVESWWALRQPHLPSDRLDYLAALQRAHRALWRAGITADFADLSADLTAYRLLLVPSHYLATDAVAEQVRRYVGGGGRLLVWYFSGVADEHGRVRVGGYPGAFREVLGVRVEELCPLPPGETVALSDGSHGTLWSERVRLTGATSILEYADGPLAGLPAVTRSGHAWYVSTELADDAYQRLLDEALTDAGVAPAVPGLPPGVEVVRRREGWLFAINHTGDPVEIPGTGRDLVTGADVTGRLTVPAGGFAVLQSK